MFDSHAHVAAEQFNDDRADVAARAKAGGLAGWIEIGTTVPESRLAVELAQHYEGVWATVGVHPSEAAGLSDASWVELEGLAQKPKVVAIGEVGFDFFHTSPIPRRKAMRDAELRVAGRDSVFDLQRQSLMRFIDLARTKNLPVVFHVRDGKEDNAHEALIALLGSYGIDNRPRGVIHTYSGTLVQAEKYLALGIYLSFSGVVTFKNAGQLLDVAKMVPSDKYLLETDCPFLAPEPYRGQRNEPAYVHFVAKKIADVRRTSVEEIERQTDENVKRLFSL